MDWLRRNWPDVAIGVALIAVIAGIVTTLITGGSMFQSNPVASGTAGQIPPAVQAPVQPDSPTPIRDSTSDPQTLAASTGTVEPPTLAATPTTPAAGSVSVLAPDGTPVATPPVTTPSSPAATTPAATAAPAATPTAAPPATTAPATPAAVTAPTNPTPVVVTPATPPATPAAVSSSAAAPYRISVGAFASAENAARQAQRFRDAGFPVFEGAQGDLVIVLVGPYNTEQEADAVRTQIAGGGFGIEPVVYRFRPDAPTPGASTPNPGASTPASTPPAATPPAATPPAATPPAATPPAATQAPQPLVGRRSLQVGAFADAASAAPLRQRLSAIGLATFEVREDGLIKLLVGPFDDARLAEVRTQLSELGIESFAR